MGRKSRLEEEFDKHHFSSVLVNREADNEFMSSRFEASQIDCGRNDHWFNFKIKNYLLDRFLDEKHSFLNGYVLVKLGYPVIIKKKNKTKKILIYSPEFWALNHFSKDDLEESYESLFKDIVKKFSKKINKQYPSINNFKGEKIRFLVVKYEFTSDTEEKQIPRIRGLLEKLLDDDDFIDYLFKIMIPLALFIRNEVLIIEKKIILEEQRYIKSFLQNK